MKEDVAMQSRCIFCGAEQYAPAVYEISYGRHPCVWCGQVSSKMTVKAYNLAITKIREKK